ncbi:MAG: CsbD family protein [Candidatus Sumerlaeaceae bacterium]
MNKDQIKGRVEEVIGKVKQSTGRNSGDLDQQDEGAGQELKGKVQKTFGDVKHNIAKEIDR